MADRPDDALLKLGRALALILQGGCALAAGIVLLLIPAAILISQGMLGGLMAPGDLPILEKSPPSVVGILLMLAAILAAMFVFFGKMRALIRSVAEGTPFIPANARRLGAMAWLLLGVQVLALLVGGLRLHLANLVYEAANGPDHLDIGFYDLNAILIVLILFILARVFREGAAMRDDLAGTI